MKSLLSRLIPLGLVLALAGCKTDSTVRITNAAPPPKPVAQSRSEPIFYNGKTYRLDFSPSGGGAYSMAVSGMTAKQKSDAINVATSSLAYFACPDGQRGKLQSEAAYAGDKWRMIAKCG